MLQRGQQWTITTRDVARRRHDLRHDVQGLPGDVQPRRPDPDRRRQGPAPGHRRSPTPTSSPRCWSAARSATTRASTCPASRCRCPRCRRRTRPTCGSRCSLSVDFIALSFVRDAKDAEDVRQIMREEGVPPPGHRQDREAAGDRQPRRGDRGLRRVHGRPRRPRGGVPAGGGAVPAEAGHREGPAQRQAGDRRDPDARVDDHQPGADPRRGQRRRQRRARRRRRGDAVRRDQRGGVPHPHRRDDGPDHHRDRGRTPSSSTPSATSRRSTGTRAPAAA